MRISAGAVLLVAGLWAGTSRAQDTKVVTVGPEYAANWVERIFLGSGYRDLWTTPVCLPMLDLANEGGGLTPVRQVGQAQSVGLALKGADGRAYTFRSLHKEPQRMLPAQWQDTWAAKVAQDQTSGTHPAAGVILTPLAEAAGVPNSRPRLVVMPDDSTLGKFRKTFGNQIGTIEEYPLPAGNGNSGFMGATEIVSSGRMWQKWLEGPENQIDAHAYLRARILDLWVENFDRHRGQWRWMRVPGKDTWQPLPEDPDFVLLYRDGLVMQSLRARRPQFLKFEREYQRRLEGPLANSFEMDRWILSSLSAQDFEAMARELQSLFTDEVIERALRRMPAEWYPIDGPRKIEALQNRRAGLVDYMLRVYQYYAREVDVHATDRDEQVVVSRGDDNSVEVTMTLADQPGQPYYHRRFAAPETKEVRIFLHGGDDHVERTGQPAGPVTIRVIAGGGADVVDDSKSGGTDVWCDAGDANVQPGDGTRVRRNAWANPSPVKDAPWIEPRSFGHWSRPGPSFGYWPDLRVTLGYGVTRTAWGFRTAPSKSVQWMNAVFATGTLRGSLEYRGVFRRPVSRTSLELHALVSGISRFNYFGPGNESPPQSDRARYGSQERVGLATPSLRYEYGRMQANLGPEVRYSRTPPNEGTLLTEQSPYGTGPFGQVALRSWLTLDTRAASSATAELGEILEAGAKRHASGAALKASGFFAPKVWSVLAAYGAVDAEGAAYLGNTRAQVTLRAGGRKLWGPYPWFEAAYVGGHNNRGFHSHRFTGDSSLFGSVEFRGWLGDLNTPVLPLRVGMIGFFDIGRVWLEGEDSSTWHQSVGGGMILQPPGAAMAVSGIAAHSNEDTRFYLALGYPF